LPLFLAVLPVRIMGTLVVLLTMDEDALFDADEEEEDRDRFGPSRA
jgi:hypothetical protein